MSPWSWLAYDVGAVAETATLRRTPCDGGVEGDCAVSPVKSGMKRVYACCDVCEPETALAGVRDEVLVHPEVDADLVVRRDVDLRLDEEEVVELVRRRARVVGLGLDERGVKFHPGGERPESWSPPARPGAIGACSRRRRCRCRARRARRLHRRRFVAPRTGSALVGPSSRRALRSQRSPSRRWRGRAIPTTKQPAALCIRNSKELGFRVRVRRALGNSTNVDVSMPIGTFRPAPPTTCSPRKIGCARACSISHQCGETRFARADVDFACCI